MYFCFRFVKPGIKTTFIPKQKVAARKNFLLDPVSFMYVCFMCVIVASTRRNLTKTHSKPYAMKCGMFFIACNTKDVRVF